MRPYAGAIREIAGKSASGTKQTLLFGISTHRNYFILLLAAFFLFCFGEEISWGQELSVGIRLIFELKLILKVKQIFTTYGFLKVSIRME